jgi:citrate lyase beta subunit
MSTVGPIPAIHAIPAAEPTAQAEAPAATVDALIYELCEDGVLRSRRRDANADWQRSHLTRRSMSSRD